MVKPVRLLFLLTGMLPDLATSQYDKVWLVRDYGRGRFNLGKIKGLARDLTVAVWFSDQVNRSLVRFHGTTTTGCTGQLDISAELGSHFPQYLIDDSQVGTGFIITLWHETVCIT